MLSDYKNKTIVFFGDSITDTCKWYHQEHPYGAGFVNILKSEFDVSYPDLNIKVFNGGIGGNKTEDLILRFDQDVKSKKPDIVFLLIGINDIWHPYDKNIEPNINDIIYRIDQIITNIKNINSKIVVLTPFLFPNNDYFNNLMPYFNNLSNEYLLYIKENNIEYIDLYKIMKKSNTFNITKDSVHPTLYGHGIIAQAIIEYLEK